MRAIDLAFFLIVSSALHVAALVLTDLPGGGGGTGGQHDVSLQPASAAVRALARAWDTPPPVAKAPTPARPQPEATPTAPTATLPPTRMAALAKPTPQPDPRSAPVADTRLPVNPNLIPPKLAALSTPADTPTSLPSPQPMAPSDRPVLKLPPAIPTPNGPSAPRTDTRLPANPGLMPTDLAALAAPSAASTAPPAPQRAAAPSLSKAPTIPTPKAAIEPQVDTESAAPRHAPSESLRPKPRAPKRTAKRASTAAPALRARGAKSATVSPGPAAAGASGQNGRAAARAQAEWGARIRAAVARAQRYPRGTTASGTAKVQIVVLPSGRVQSMSLIRSSGNRALDRAALGAVRSARLPRAPKVLTGTSYRFNLPLVFTRD